MAVPLSAPALRPSGTFFTKHRTPSQKIESSGPDSLPIENCSPYVGIFERSSVKFRSPKIRPCEMCIFELRMAENGAPKLHSIQMRTNEIRVFQIRIPKLRTAQIRITKIEFAKVVETLARGRRIFSKNRQDRLDVCSWLRFVAFAGPPNPPPHGSLRG